MKPNAYLSLVKTVPFITIKNSQISGQDVTEWKAEEQAILTYAPYAIYAKAAILAQKGDWSGADSLMKKAVSLASDKEFFEKERSKFARKESRIVVRQSFTFSL
jgi:hypothetical protein